MYKKGPVCVKESGKIKKKKKFPSISFCTESIDKHTHFSS